MSQQHTAESQLPRVRFMRWSGCWGSWEPAETSLLAFVYDYHVPLGACGVFPPLHILNDFLLRGGGGGGMGPGAKWEPFSLSKTEYDALVEAIRTVPPSSVVGLPGPGRLAFTFDPAFDGDPATYPAAAEVTRPKLRLSQVPETYRAYVTWLNAVCAKHRARHHAELRAAGLMK